MILAFCFILSSSMISASALEPNYSLSEDNEVETAVMNPVDSSTFYLKDGTKITIAVLPIIQTRSGSDIDSAWARPNASHTFPCNKEDGNHLRAVVNNIGETDMRVTYTLDVGEYSESKVISPDNRFYIDVDSKDGEGLTYKLGVTIEAVLAQLIRIICLRANSFR